MVRGCRRTCNRSLEPPFVENESEQKKKNTKRYLVICRNPKEQRLRHIAADSILEKKGFATFDEDKLREASPSTIF